MDTVHSPITTIPGIGDRMRAMVLAEIGDFSHFDASSAYADMSPIGAAFMVWNILAHGKARLSILALRSLQRNQIRLPLGSNLWGLSGPNTSRG